jgi:hypothetical protein
LRINHENLRIYDLRTGTLKKFADCDSGMHQKICINEICGLYTIVCLPASAIEEMVPEQMRRMN